MEIAFLKGEIYSTLTQKLHDSLAAEIPRLTRREIRLPAVPGKGLAVIGMRRSGKTCFLSQCMSVLRVVGHRAGGEEHALLAADAAHLAIVLRCDLGKGNRLTQSRRDVNDRKAISDVRIFLKSYVMPLSDDPFREFKDGWGIKFTVNGQIGRRQVKTIEDDEIADERNDDSPFTFQDDIDPVEMAGFSIRRT